VRVRTTARELEPQLPSLRELGVGHVLVDHHEIVPGDLADELVRLRALID
jgi:hypothetical protein